LKDRTRRNKEPNDVPRRGGSPTIWLVLTLILTAAGLLLGNRALELSRAFVPVADWPSVTATVVESRVIGERAFRPLIAFDYTVDSTAYRDTSDLNMPSFGGRTNRLSAAENMAKEYPVGSEVTVHYNPADPGDARLKVSLPFSLYAQMGVAGFLLLGGIFSALIAIRMRAAHAYANR
jgi:hypothetical protein